MSVQQAASSRPATTSPMSTFMTVSSMAASPTTSSNPSLSGKARRHAGLLSNGHFDCFPSWARQSCRPYCRRNGMAQPNQPNQPNREQDKRQEQGGQSRNESGGQKQGDQNRSDQNRVDQGQESNKDQNR